MSSGGKGGRGNKNSRVGGDKQNTGSNTSHKDTSDSHRSELLTTEKDKESLPHKIPPTAEQLRLAQMIGNTKTEPDKVFQEKLNQVMQFTGVSSDEALVALHDCDNDVSTAVDNLLEGDVKGQWLASTKKKKKSPANKVVETESNKENRKADNRERSGSRPRGGGPPRFRGRGGSRGGKDGDGDGPGRGEGSRRGSRMANGGPLSRGRGGRGRGSGPGPRTFQNRQPPGFPDSIDTWGSTEPQDQQNSLKIDTWDEEPVAPSEDWDDEWTGSLDQTTVFGPSSTVGGSMPPVEEHLAEQLLGNQNAPPSTPQQSFPPPTQPSTLPQPSHLEFVALLQKAAPHSTLSGLGTGSQLGGNSGGLGSGVGPLGSTGVGGLVNNGVGPLGNGTGVGTLGNGTGVGGLGTTSGMGGLGGIGSSNGVGGLCSSSLGASGNNGMGSSGQHSILSSLSNSMGEALKSSGLVNTVGGSGSNVSTSVPAPYTSPTSPMQNSMFSNPGLHSVSSSLSNSINSSSSNSVGMNKSVTMPGAPSSVPVLPSRQKTQRSRITHSSKIPLSAVEMPEDAMATLDMQFTGLEFGAETFDLNSEIKVSQASNPNNSMQTATHSVAHVSSHPVSKDLSSVTSLPPSLTQTSKLGPDPISYPTSQTSDRKQSSSAFVTTGQRGSGGSATSQGLADLSKKDATSSGLGSLMGSPSAPNPYQPSYSSKTSTSFPSPPAASYVPPPSHQMSSYSNSQSGSNSGYNSSVVGSNNNSNSNNAIVSSTQNSGVYGSSFSAQVSTGTGSNQYQNSYVNSSSHSSLASMSTPKTLSGLKDSSQSYSEASTGGSGGLSNTLVTSVTGTSVSVGSNSGANAGLSTALNATPHHTQPSKTLPAKAVNVNNSLGSNMQSTVQSHQATHIQTQHHQQHQQQQQAQQLMAQPSQYVSPQPALQGSLPPAFYNLQQPAMYSYEDLQLLQQRMPHMQQTPTTITTGREGNIPSAAYTVADNKFRTDQNSSPVPSSINQQGATAGGTYITATGNAALPPFYMYHNVAAVPSSFPQYGAPTIIQIPPNTHTGSNTTQFPGAPKLPYGSANYYDSVSQNPDFKSGYATTSQGQSKAGSASSGSATNSGNDLAPYKNHLSKTYDKQAFHTGTPPPFNLAGSGTNPMTANAYTPMFIPTLPAGAQHHSQLMHHHQLHQDGGSTGGQRSGNSSGQNKGGSKPYAASYWATN